MSRRDVPLRLLGGVYTIVMELLLALITIPVSGVYMFFDLLWELLFEKDFPYGESAAMYHIRLYKWGASNWKWVVMGDGRFDWLPKKGHAYNEGVRKR